MAIIRKPTQEDDTSDTTDEVGENVAIEEPLQLEGNPPAKETPAKEVPKEEPSGQMDIKTNSAIARAVTGATPALMGMLFGASPMMAEDQIVQGQKFYAGGVPKKMVLTKDKNGNPVYTDIREAPGEEAWTKPVKTGAGTGPKPTSFYNPETKQVEKGFADPSTRKYFNAAGKEVPGAQEFVPAAFKEVTDAYGNVSTVPMSTVTGGLLAQPTKLAAGEGAIQGGIPTKQLETAYKSAAEYPKQVQAMEQQKQSIDASIKMIESGYGIEQYAGIIGATKNLLQQKEADATALEPPGYFQSKLNQLESLITSKPTATEVNAVKSMLLELRQSQVNQMTKAASSTAQSVSGGNKAAQKFMQQRLSVPASMAGSKLPSNYKFLSDTQKREIFMSLPYEERQKLIQQAGQ